MKNFFNRILVPVLFNSDTPAVMQKAVDVANEFECDIHLLHVITPGKLLPLFSGLYFSTLAGHDQVVTNERKMETLVEDHRPGLRDGLLIGATVRAGNWQNVMKDVIITHHIDLVIIPGQVKRFFETIMRQVDINRLSQQTKCPVLTVTSGFDLGHLQNIVVPINDFLPLRKLTAATYLAKKFNGVVHLLGQNQVSPTEDKNHTTYLAHAYQLLSDYTRVKLYYPSQKGSNMANDTLAYANSVGADLIVVNPGKESLLSGWFNKWLRQYLYNKSNIPVLTISPQQ